MLPPTLAARLGLSSGCSNFVGCLPPSASLMHGVLNSMLQFCFYWKNELAKSLNLFGSFHFAAHPILQNIDHPYTSKDWALRKVGQDRLTTCTNMTKEFNIFKLASSIPASYPPSQPFQQWRPTFWQFPPHIDAQLFSTTPADKNTSVRDRAKRLIKGFAFKTSGTATLIYLCLPNLWWLAPDLIWVCCALAGIFDDQQPGG